MYQLTTSMFHIFHPVFFQREFLPLLVKSYVEEEHLLRGRFYGVPNLFPTHLESRFAKDYDLLRLNLAYRLAGTEPYPEAFESFEDRHFELVENEFALLENKELERYVADFLGDCLTAHQLYRMTYAIVEPVFSDEALLPLEVHGAKGGFSCMG